MMSKSYSELIHIPTFEERFEYLKLMGNVGEYTFGFSRSMNQEFYSSPPWKRFRRDMILRDNGLDLAFEGHEIYGRIIVLHHIIPLTKRMIVENHRLLMDPENVVCCSDNTHKAIHYGDSNLLIKSPMLVERKPNDTTLWRR